MKLAVIALGKPKISFILDGWKYYEQRLKPLLAIEWLFIPDPAKGKSINENQRRGLDSAEILKRIGPKDRVFLLDERGTLLTSDELSVRIYSALATVGQGRLCFLIGGPYGVAQAIYRRADLVISLSRFTLTHEMALLLLTEQIYRSAMIYRGSKYHHR